MTDSQKEVYIFSQCIAALARIEGMKASNEIAQYYKQFPKHDEGAFQQIEKDFLIGTNDVIGFLNG